MDDRDNLDLSSLDDDSLAQGNQEDESSFGYSSAEDDHPTTCVANKQQLIVGQF